MAWWNFRVFGEGCFGWVCSTHRGPNGDWERTRYFEKRSPSPATGIFPWASPAPRLVAPVLKDRLLGAQGHGWCLAWSRFPRHHLDTGRRHLLMLSIPPLSLASLFFLELSPFKPPCHCSHKQAWIRVLWDWLTNWLLREALIWAPCVSGLRQVQFLVLVTEPGVGASLRIPQGPPPPMLFAAGPGSSSAPTLPQAGLAFTTTNPGELHLWARADLCFFLINK